MRRLVLLLAIAATLAHGPAIAAPEGPHLAVIGFARDGSAFAFEQFGWSDGVAYPFSDLTVINTATGVPFSGAPIQVTIARDGATQQSARMMAYTAAQTMLAGFQIDQPGVVVASASGRSDDPATREVAFDAPGMGRLKVRLDTAIVKSVGCDALGVKVRALAIRLMDAGGTLLRDLHKEKNPPPERQCPTGYGIAEIRAFPREGKPPVLAIIVGMERPGAGHPDRRYIGFAADLAVPVAAAEKEKE